MFAGLRRALGAIAVRESRGVITVSGVPADVIARDIEKIWATSRVNKWMFNRMGRSEFSFYSFFAIEVAFILRTLVENPAAHTNVRALRIILDKLEEETWLNSIDRTANLKFAWEQLKQLNLELLPSQRDFLENFEDKVAQYRLNGYMLAAPPGTGKAQPLDSLVKVPGSWKRMGDMQVGDDVISADGSTCKVLGVFPQGARPVYKLTFADGRTAECDENHLWKVFDREVKGDWSIIDTKELLRKFAMPSKQGRLYVPVCASEQGADVELPIDPYLLGVLLGDGTFRHHTGVCLPNLQMREVVREKLLAMGCEMTPCKGSDIDFNIVGIDRKNNVLLKKVTEMGLFNKYSYEKAIPEEYLLASHEQRVALIKGLMDSDGTCGFTGGATFDTSSPNLAKGVEYLIRSIGGLARTATRTTSYTHKGEKRYGRLSYRINIRHKTPSILFGYEEKKLAKAEEKDDGQYSAGFKLRIDNIEFVGEKETQCIEISHPEHLYVTNNFVVTHNTISGISLALIAEADKVIVIAPKRAVNEVWTSTLDIRFKEPQHYWHSNSEVPQTGLKNGAASNNYAVGLRNSQTPILNHDSKTPDVNAKWFVFHYEQLDTALAMVAGAYGDWKSKRTVILLDECHNLNETSSQRSAKFIELCRASNALYTLWASGTPIKAIGNEAIPFLRTIDNLFNEEVQKRFVMIFGKQASRAVDILSHRIGLSSFKVPKADVVTIPVSELTKNVAFKGAEAYTLDKIRDEIKKFVDERLNYYKVNYRMFQAQYDDLIIKYKKTIRDREEQKDFELYQNYVKHLNKNFDPRADKDIVIFCNRFEASKILPKLSGQDKKVFRHTTSIVKYVSLKVRGEALGRILTRRRIDCFVAMIPHCGLPDIIDSSKKKTLIFTSYVEVVKALDQYLRKEGYSPLLVYGDTNKMLAPIMKEFKTNPDANPMIATFDSLSTAVPVIEANTCVLMNQPFRDHEREQATSRVNRLGQDTPVNIITTLVDTGMDPNISTRSNEILEWSRASVAAIMGLGDLDDTVYSTEDFVPNELVQAETKELDVFFADSQTPKVSSVQYSAESFYYGKLK